MQNDESKKPGAIEFQQAQKTILAVLENVSKVIKGKSEKIQHAISAWIAGGHVLFEDVPGTGKTMLARALAMSTGQKINRIQFTPDLLPADIVGTSIYSKTQDAFVFHQGPLFTDVLIADEINRATPRTQSALLEGMAEGRCTAEGKTYALSKNFFVIATQNPVEQQGTFPLPEAQLDRFMMRLSLGYPGLNDEKQIIVSQLLAHPIDSIEAVTDAAQWHRACEISRHISVSQAVLDYTLKIVTATRSHPMIELGCSPRASIAMIRCAQAYSLMRGEGYVRPDTIKELCLSIISHRLSLTTQAKIEQKTTPQVVLELLTKIPVPRKP